MKKPKRHPRPVRRENVVLVHGIGHHKAGATFQGMGEPIAAAITRLSEVHGFECHRPEFGMGRGPTSETELEIVDASNTTLGRIFIREVRWAGTFKVPRGNLLWTLSRIPAAFLLLMIDARDLGDSTTDLPGERFFTEKVGLRFLLRGLQVLCATLWASVILIWAYQTFPPLLAVIGVVLVILLESRRVNIAGHVRVATRGGEVMDEITHGLEDALASLPTDAPLTIVGHSQGGYLAHVLLQSGRLRGARCLWGIGSGLKAITILRHAQSTGRILAAWFFAMVSASSLLGMAFLLFENIGLAASLIELWRVLTDMAILTGRVPSDASIKSTMTTGLEVVREHISEGSLFAVVPYAILWGLGAWVAARSWAFPPPRVAPLGKVRSWREISSVYDVVGRIAVPKLPSNVKEETVTVGGGPLSDHLQYFADHSVVPLYIADDLAARCGMPSIRAQIDLLNFDFKHFARRRRRFMWAMAGLIFYNLFSILLAFGRSSVDAAVQTLMAVTLIVVTMRFCLALVERRMQRRGISKMLESGTWAVKSRIMGYRARVAVGIALLLSGMLSIGTYTTDQLLVSRGDPDEIGGWMYIPPDVGGVLVVGGCIGLLYGAAYVSGYRPRVWVLAALMLLGSYVWSAVDAWVVIPEEFGPGYRAGMPCLVFGWVATVGALIERLFERRAGLVGR